MINLALKGQVDSILGVGAHPDDLEIGAFGLFRRLAAGNPTAQFDFVILSGDEVRQTEAIESARAMLDGRVRIHSSGARDGFLPYDSPSDSKEFLRSVVSKVGPQLVIAPRAEDRHQDHSFARNLVDQTCRESLVLGYEIPKFDADLGRPNLYVELSEDESRAKVEHLQSNFASQNLKPWNNPDTFFGLMRLRGVECKASSGLAEAFFHEKGVLFV